MHAGARPRGEFSSLATAGRELCGLAQTLLRAVPWADTMGGAPWTVRLWAVQRTEPAVQKTESGAARGDGAAADLSLSVGVRWRHGGGVPRVSAGAREWCDWSYG